MRKTNPFTDILLFLFWPARFVKRAVQHDVELEFETNQQLRAAFPDKTLPPDRLNKFQDNAWNRTRSVRIAFFSALGLTLLAIAVGLIAGYFLKRNFCAPSSRVTSALQISGAAIILVATLAKVGWKIQSWNGETLPEKADRWMFRALYVIGTFLFVLSLGWAY
jgi:hypothetical protein